MIIWDWIVTALEKPWFYIGAIILGLMYGYGGLVHVGNILGYGELSWSESPLAWKLGDVFWGVLDIVAVVGILMRSPIGVIALIIAAVSQIIVYGFWPGRFALTDEHYTALNGMVYFHIIVLAAIAGMVWFAITRNSS